MLMFIYVKYSILAARLAVLALAHISLTQSFEIELLLLHIPADPPAMIWWDASRSKLCFVGLISTQFDLFEWKKQQQLYFVACSCRTVKMSGAVCWYWQTRWISLISNAFGLRFHVCAVLSRITCSGGGNCVCVLEAPQACLSQSEL